MIQSLSILISLGLSAVLGLAGNQISANLNDNSEPDTRIIGDSNLKLPVKLESNLNARGEVTGGAFAGTASPSPSPVASVSPSPIATVAPSAQPSTGPSAVPNTIPVASATPVASAQSAASAAVQASTSPQPTASVDSAASSSVDTEAEIKLPVEVSVGNSNLVGISLGL